MFDSLPIYAIEADLVAQARQHSRLILSAPTGSGKSTQVPQMLLRHGLLETGEVVVLQPRRLATRLLARRVAEELGVPLGREVGYQVRFENVTSAATRIRFVTEGILLRQMLGDEGLKGVSTIVFDEFHERHLYGDITLARALDLQARQRPDLRLIVMSATLDAQRLQTYLHPCAVLRSEGRTFPVEIEYADRPAYSDERPVWDQAADAFAAHARRTEPGDVLVFMPGAYEIQRTLEAMRARPESRGFLFLALHGELAPKDQDAAVARYDRPKIVVATNVAETSITIDGVRLVIDSGLARIPRHDPWRGINTLLIEKISRASADQRAGRAGRTAAGTCLRLWSLDEHAHRPAQELPEIRRLDLAEVVLTLKAAGVEDLRTFRWLDPPEAQALAHAEELLLDLGALSGPTDVAAPAAEAPRSAAGAEASAGGGAGAGVGAGAGAGAAGEVAPPAAAHSVITALGRRMLTFPVHPRYARLLLAAQEHGCVRDAALIAALTQGRDLLLRKVDKETVRSREDRLGDKADSDFFQVIRAWEYAAQNDFRIEACRRVGVHALTARQVASLFESYLRLAEREGLDVEAKPLNEVALRRCILMAFSDHVARRVDSGTLRCEMVHARKGVLARESVVQQSPVLVAAEVREVGGRGGEVNTILSLVTAIEPAWLQEAFPEDLERGVRVFYDPTARRVFAEEQLKFRGLALEARRFEPPPEDAAARLLADEVLAGRLTLVHWDHAVDQWICRLNCLARWCPELQLPAIGETDRRDLVEQLCHGAFGYKEIKERPAIPVVRSWLSAVQAEWVDQLAPERLELSNGRRPKVTYAADLSPTIALRIQELFGVDQTPRIAKGRVGVTVQILAPSMRPVQVTQDLGSFWREHYPKLKSELQRKYPKHEWR